MIFYVDGTQTNIIITAAVANVSVYKNCHMGANPVQIPILQYRGSLDDIRVWSISRTATDIANNFKTCLTGNEPGLVANWRFDHIQGPGAYDFSINNHHIAFPNFQDYAPHWLSNGCISDHSCFYYSPVPLANPSCNPNPIVYHCGETNLVCNGGFEQHATAGNLHIPVFFNNCNTIGTNFFSNDVNNWCDFNSTGSSCDLFDRSFPGTWDGIPNNKYTIFSSIPAGVQTWDWPNPNNNTYAGFVISSNSANCWAEGMTTSLVSPVMPGVNYKFSIHINNVSPAGVNLANLKIYLQENQYSGQTLPLIDQSIPLIAYNGQWVTLTYNFTNTLAVPLPYLVITSNCYTFPAHYLAKFFIDDVFLSEDPAPLWPKYGINNVSGPGSTRPEDIITDNTGNVYATGYYY